MDLHQYHVPPGATCTDGDEHIGPMCVTAECAAGLLPTDKNSCETECLIKFAILIDAAAAAASSSATGATREIVRAGVKRIVFIYNIADFANCIDECNNCK